MFLHRFGLCLTLANALLIAQTSLNAATTQMNTTKYAGFLGSGASGPITAVTGSWKVPAVTCNESDPRALFFVGIDGIVEGNTDTIEQIGTGTICKGVNSPEYYAWYEFMPNESTVVPIDGFIVRANDTITATVNFSGGQFTATIKDGAQTFTTPLTSVSNAHQSNAECIVERQPGQSEYPLADYGVATFSSCLATVNGTRMGIGQFPTVIRLTMDDPTLKAVLAFTSSLSGATSFLVHGCAPPPLGTVGWWPGDGMVAWWPGDGNADDIIGGNNGDPVGVTYAPGEVGPAFSFNGSGAYLYVPPNASFHPGAITVELWLNATDLSSVDNASSIISSDLNDYDGYQLQIQTDGTIGFVIGGGNTVRTYYTSTSGAIAIGHWYHIAVTYDAVGGVGSLKLYLNGVQDSFTLSPGSFVEPSGPIYYSADYPLNIGRRAGDETIPFNGLADEVTIFGRPLSATEILAIYKAGRAGKCKQ